MIFPPLLTNQKALERSLNEIGIHAPLRIVYARPWHDGVSVLGAFIIGPSIWTLTALLNRPSYIVFEENQMILVRTFSIGKRITRFAKHQISELRFTPVTSAESNDYGVGYKLTFTSRGQRYCYFVLAQYKLHKNEYLDRSLEQTVCLLRKW